MFAVIDALKFRTPSRLQYVISNPRKVMFQVEIRPIMTVALTYDHRLIDGREAVTFLTKIKAAVEDPRIMLMDL